MLPHPDNLVRRSEYFIMLVLDFIVKFTVGHKSTVTLLKHLKSQDNSTGFIIFLNK